MTRRSYPRQCSPPTDPLSPRSSSRSSPSASSACPGRPDPQGQVRRVAPGRPRRRYVHRREAAPGQAGSATPVAVARSPAPATTWAARSRRGRARLALAQADRLVDHPPPGDGLVEVQVRGRTSGDRTTAGTPSRARRSATRRSTETSVGARRRPRRPEHRHLAGAQQRHVVAGPGLAAPFRQADLSFRSVGAMAYELPDVDVVATLAGVASAGTRSCRRPALLQMVHSDHRSGRETAASVILADLDPDRARLLPVPVRARDLRLGREGPPAAVGRPRRTLDVRPACSGTALALRHGVRRPLAGGPTFVTGSRPARGPRFIAADPASSPRSPRVRGARGTPIGPHQRPPAGHRRLHPQRRHVVDDHAAQQSAASGAL